MSGTKNTLVQAVTNELKKKALEEDGEKLLKRLANILGKKITTRDNGSLMLERRIPFSECPLCGDEIISETELLEAKKKKKAKKVWDERQYKNLDDSVELGTRNIKMALRRLRKFARTGVEEELDIDDTIRSTAHNGGMLDIKMRPERRNTVKVLLFLDIGGSMDAHVKICEELFSASRTEFKHLESFSRLAL